MLGFDRVTCNNNKNNNIYLTSKIYNNVVIKKMLIKFDEKGYWWNY